jgi:hypothetical protein
MKHLLPVLTLVLALPAGLTSCSKESIAAEAAAKAAAPAASNDPASFLAAYRKAVAAKDKAALDAFLLTEGSPAEVVEFFKMMRDSSLEGSVTVELKTPSPEEAAQFNQAMEMPDGKYYKLPVTPSHQLVVTSESKEGESTSKSSSSFPVAQKDGRFVIPLPIPTGQASKES